MRLVAAGDDLDRGAAMLAKFRQQRVQFCIIERIPARMRNYRYAAASLDPADRVGKARPLMRNEAWLPRAQVTVEGDLHILHGADFYQVPREMRPAHHIGVCSQLADAFP